MLDRHCSTQDLFGVLVRSATGTLQFISAVVVAALYGVDLGHATSSHSHAQADWIYAEVVACLSILTCTLYCFITVKHVAWAAWDWTLSILWAAQFGVFVSIYVAAAAYRNSETYNFTTSVERMKAGLWFSFINLILWLITAVMGVAWCCHAKRSARRTDRLDPGKVFSDEDEESVRAKSDDVEIRHSLLDEKRSHRTEDFKEINKEVKPLNPAHLNRALE